MVNPLAEIIEKLIESSKELIQSIQANQERLKLLEKERLEKLAEQAKLVHFGDKK